MTPHLPLRVVVLMPLRDDWTAAAELIRRVDRAVSPEAATIEIVLVDDASAQRYSHELVHDEFTVVRAIRILRLRRNLGHQRAIAIGLVEIHNTAQCDAIIVMDADGEDTPEGVTTLLRVYSETRDKVAVFAERTRRSESLVFRAFYHLYRILHLGLTGISVRVGNFSILPPGYLTTIVVMSELWSHYAAAVFRSKLPFVTVPIPRGTRIAGISKMNFVSLVSHGLSAISVFGDIVGVRLLIGSMAGSLMAGLGIAFVVMTRFFAGGAIPGWTTYAAGTLAIIMIQLLTIATSFTFFILANRMNLVFVPSRDSLLFLEDAANVYPHA